MAKLTPEVREAIIEAARQFNVPADVMFAVARQESAFKPDAKARTSSATGLFQHIDSTWNTMVDRYGSRFGITRQTPRTDPKASALMGAAFMAENARQLNAVGLEVTPSSLYMAHFAGAKGAIKALTAPPDKPASAVFGRAAAKANSFMSGKTVAEVRQFFDNKMARYTEQYAPATPANMNKTGIGWAGSIAPALEPIEPDQASYTQRDQYGMYAPVPTARPDIYAEYEAQRANAFSDLPAIATAISAAANPSQLGGLNYSVPSASPLPNPSQLGGLNYSVPAAPFSGRASYPETPRSFPPQSAPASSSYPETPRSFPSQSPSYQTDNRATQAMFDALPMDTYFQDKLAKAAKAENNKIGLASRFPGMGDIPERVAPSYPTSTGISAAIGGAGRPSAPSVGSMPGATPAGLGGLNYSVAPATKSAAPPMSAGLARTPAQLGGLNYSVPPATQPSLADQYANYGAGKATTNRAPNDPRAAAYRSMPPAPVMAAAIDRIDIPNSAVPAPAISPSTLAAQYAAYGAGKIAPTQSAATTTQSTPKPSATIAQKATPPALSAPRTVAPRTVTPYAPPAAPAMTPERAKALGMVETVPGMYMPNVAANPAQVMRDQAGLIARNPIASIGKMIAGTLLGGVFHAGGGLRNVAAPLAQAITGNRQQNSNKAPSGLPQAVAAALGGVGGSYSGPGGIGGYTGGGFQASPSGFGNYGSDGSFNGGMQSSSGFTFDR